MLKSEKNQLFTPSIYQIIRELNIVNFFCNIIQLYMLSNTHIQSCVCSIAFKTALFTFEKQKESLPTSARVGLEYIVDSLVKPLET